MNRLYKFFHQEKSMKYKLSSLEIPADAPFKFDALDRKPSVEAVAQLIEELQGPFVLAIDSPWGSGKTTFVQLLKAVLQSKGYSCLYFDAWKTDFSTDPLVAFLGEISTLLPNEIKKDAHFQKAKKIATVLAKQGLSAAVKVEIASCLADSLSDAVDEYLQERCLIEQFHASLGKVIEKLNEGGKKSQIIIFVDEIDRCRPVYAVELLERIKHLFDIKNIIFIISLDKQQLHTSLGAVYGQGINCDEYLRRFIDLEYMLPMPETEAFTNSLFSRFEFNKLFANRTHSQLRSEKDNLVQSFTALSEIFSLSLRAREQCFTIIRVAIMTTPEKHYFFPNALIFPHLLTILTVLRVASPAVYRRYALESGTAKEVVEYLKTRKGGAKMLESHFGVVTEAYLIAAKSHWNNKSDELYEYEAMAIESSRAEAERKRAKKIIKILNDISLRGSNRSLSCLVNKLELAAQFSR